MDRAICDRDDDDSFDMEETELRVRDVWEWRLLGNSSMFSFSSSSGDSTSSTTSTEQGRRKNNQTQEEKKKGEESEQGKNEQMNEQIVS